MINEVESELVSTTYVPHEIASEIDAMIENNQINDDLIVLCKRYNNLIGRKEFAESIEDMLKCLNNESEFYRTSI
jgi:hypothetical protein